MEIKKWTISKLIYLKDDLLVKNVRIFFLKMGTFVIKLLLIEDKIVYNKYNNDERGKMMDILERKIKKLIKNGEEVTEEYKTIGEIIDPEKDVVPTDDGVIVLRRRGVEKLADYVGAAWGKPDVIMSVQNECRVLVECIFPDGTSNFGPGESSPKNTKIGAEFPLTTAINRAKSISFLRSQYIGMYDVFSDVEADAFQKQTSSNGAQNNAEVEKLVETQKKYKTMINEMAKLVALPDEDEEYPKAYINEIWEIHKDLDYLKKLTESDEKVIQWIAKQKLKEIEAETTKPKEQQLA